jgi:hypothetical protein
VLVKVHGLRTHPDYICVSRDSLRLALVRQLEGYYQRPDLNVLEQIVNGLSKAIYDEAVIYGKNLVVDNTNLKLSYLQPWIKAPQVKQWRYKFFNVLPVVAKQRVLIRDFGVYLYNGERSLDDKLKKVEYIDRQYQQYQSIKNFLLMNQPDNEIK